MCSCVHAHSWPPSQGFLVMMHLSDAQEVEQSYWIEKLYQLPWSPSKLPTVWWVDPKVDGHWGDAFVGPRDPVSLRFDLLPDFIEVCKLFGLAVQKLRIFWHRDKKRCSRWERGGVLGWRVPKNMQCTRQRRKETTSVPTETWGTWHLLFSFILSGWLIFWDSLTM